MFAPRLLPVLVAFVFSGAVFAQDFTALPPAPAPKGNEAAMPHDCTGRQARHDHGAERGMPTPKLSWCAMAGPASAAADGKVKPKMGHDHARTHKLM